MAAEGWDRATVMVVVSRRTGDDVVPRRRWMGLATNAGGMWLEVAAAVGSCHDQDEAQDGAQTIGLITKHNPAQPN
jgi:hypothetical protein